MRSLLIALLMAAVATAEPAPSVPPAELVKQLGDKSYRVRHAAAAKLLRMGSDAVAALTAGTTSTDPEVSERCKQLLPQAEALERNEKIANLLKDPKSPPPTGLPLLESYLKVAGDSKESREIYAELLGIHFRIIEPLDKKPEQAAERYRAFCEEVQARYRAAITTGRYNPDAAIESRADLTMFFIVAANKSLSQQAKAMNRPYPLFYGSKLQDSVTNGPQAPVMKKLFLDWLENESDSYMQQRGFQVAAQAKMPEAMPLAVKMLEKKDPFPHNKAQIMTTLVQYGKKEHIRLLEPYWTEKAVVTTVNFGNGRNTTVQLRDVAMGVAAQLAGQKPQEFGIDGAGLGGGFSPSSYIYYGFSDDKARDEGHAKWKAYYEKNLKTSGTTEKKDTPPETKGKEEPKSPPK